MTAWTCAATQLPPLNKLVLVCYKDYRDWPQQFIGWLERWRQNDFHPARYVWFDNSLSRPLGHSPDYDQPDTDRVYWCEIPELPF